MATAAVISFAPDDFAKGGLLDDVDIEIMDGVFTTDPPPGYTVPDRFFYRADVKTLHDGATAQVYWSAGSTNEFMPSEDGYKLVQTAAKTQMTDGSNFHLLMVSLAKEKFPLDKLKSGDVSVLKGLQMHVSRIAPERKGLKRDAGGSDRDPTTLICARIIKLPGERAKRQPAAQQTKTSAPTAAPAAAAVDADTETLAMTILSDLITAGGGSVDAKTIHIAVFKAMKDADTATKNAVSKLVRDAKWVSEHGFAVADDKITMG